MSGRGSTSRRTRSPPRGGPQAAAAPNTRKSPIRRTSPPTRGGPSAGRSPPPRFGARRGAGVASGKRAKIRKQIIADETAGRTTVSEEFDTETEVLFQEYKVATSKAKDSNINHYRTQLANTKAEMNVKIADYRGQISALASALTSFEEAAVEIGAREAATAEEKGSSIKIESDENHGGTKNGHTLARMVNAMESELRACFGSKDAENQLQTKQLRELRNAVDTHKQNFFNAEHTLRSVLVESGPQREAALEQVRQLGVEVKRKFDENYQGIITAFDKLLTDSSQVCYSHKKYNVLAARDEQKEDFVSKMETSFVQQAELLRKLRKKLVSLKEEAMALETGPERAMAGRHALSETIFEGLKTFRKEDLLLLLQRCSFYPEVNLVVSTVVKKLKDEMLAFAEYDNTPTLIGDSKELREQNEQQQHQLAITSAASPSSAIASGGGAATMTSLVSPTSATGGGTTHDTASSINLLSPQSNKSAAVITSNSNNNNDPKYRSKSPGTLGGLSSLGNSAILQYPTSTAQNNSGGVLPPPHNPSIGTLSSLTNSSGMMINGNDSVSGGGSVRLGNSTLLLSGAPSAGNLKQQQSTASSTTLNNSQLGRNLPTTSGTLTATSTFDNFGDQQHQTTTHSNTSSATTPSAGSRANLLSGRSAASAVGAAGGVSPPDLFTTLATPTTTSTTTTTTSGGAPAGGGIPGTLQIPGASRFSISVDASHSGSTSTTPRGTTTTTNGGGTAGVVAHLASSAITVQPASATGTSRSSSTTAVVEVPPTDVPHVAVGARSPLVVSMERDRAPSSAEGGGLHEEVAVGLTSEQQKEIDREQRAKKVSRIIQSALEEVVCPPGGGGTTSTSSGNDGEEGSRAGFGLRPPPRRSHEEALLHSRLESVPAKVLYPRSPYHKILEGSVQRTGTAMLRYNPLGSRYREREMTVAHAALERAKRAMDTSIIPGEEDESYETIAEHPAGEQEEPDNSVPGLRRRKTARVTPMTPASPEAVLQAQKHRSLLNELSKSS